MVTPEKVIVRPFFRVLAGIQGFLMLIVGLLILILSRGSMMSLAFIGISLYPIDLALTGGTRSGRADFKKRFAEFMRGLTYNNVKRSLKWAMTENVCEKCGREISATPDRYPDCGTVPSGAKRAENSN